ncbi:MAG TPA: hypothetical protein VGX00_03710, partial [Thermoplasmata archaeon]|nr:hypothetical protein [Thermoplasmata archaeon]
GLTMNGPVVLTATFVPNYPHKSTTLVLEGAPIAFGLLALLLVAGLAIAFVLSRRRGSVSPTRPMEPESSEGPAGGGEPEPAAPAYTEEPMATNGDTAEWAESDPPPVADMNEDGSPD